MTQETWSYKFFTCGKQYFHLSNYGGYLLFFLLRHRIFCRMWQGVTSGISSQVWLELNLVRVLFSLPNQIRGLILDVTLWQDRPKCHFALLRHVGL